MNCRTAEQIDQLLYQYERALTAWNVLSQQYIRYKHVVDELARAPLTPYTRTVAIGTISTVQMTLDRDTYAAYLLVKDYAEELGRLPSEAQARKLAMERAFGWVG